MILVDRSVWVNHLRKGDPDLIRLLDHGQVLTHPFIIGELALGNLRQRDEMLGAICALPRVSVAADPEVLHFIEERALFGRGVGYLLAAVRLMPEARLWTRDRRLCEAAERLGVAVF